MCLKKATGFLEDFCFPFDKIWDYTIEDDNNM